MNIQCNTYYNSLSSPEPAPRWLSQEHSRRLQWGDKIEEPLTPSEGEGQTGATDAWHKYNKCIHWCAQTLSLPRLRHLVACLGCSALLLLTLGGAATIAATTLTLKEVKTNLRTNPRGGHTRLLLIVLWSSFAVFCCFIKVIDPISLSRLVPWLSSALLCWQRRLQCSAALGRSLQGVLLEMRKTGRVYWIARLLKQRKRVQDPSLLSTKNLHEVKHWVEPGNVMLCNVML